MGITLADNLRLLTRGPLTIHDRGITHDDIVWDPRIGIRVGTDKMWRATVQGHKCVSGKKIRLSR
jgi:3-methyladenine DNA glycosylase Mpg